MGKRTMIEEYVLKYKKDLEPIQVLKYTGYNYDEVVKFVGNNLGEIKYAPKEWFVGFQENVLEFKDEVGKMYCYAGDYIINKNNNTDCPYRFYPCRKHFFEKYYELYNNKQK